MIFSVSSSTLTASTNSRVSKAHAAVANRVAADSTAQTAKKNGPEAIVQATPVVVRCTSTLPRAIHPVASTTTRLLRAFLAFLILLSAQITMAEVVIAGQTLGKSSWSDRARLKTPKYRIEEVTSTAYENGKVLRIEGPLSGNIQGKAEFFYDQNRTLAAARLFTKKPEALLRRLASTSSAAKNKDGSFTAGNLRLRLESEGDLRFIQVSSPAFDADWRKSRSIASIVQNLSWLHYLALSAFVLLGWLSWRFRKSFWARRVSIADYCAGFAVVSALIYFLPITRLGIQGGWLG